MEIIRNRDDLVEQLIEKPKYNYRYNGDICHDINHYNEVMDFALEVAKIHSAHLEKRDIQMVKVAASWHDYGRGMECEELGDDHAKISVLCLEHDLLFHKFFDEFERNIIKRAIRNHRTEADCDSWLTAIIKLADLACVRTRERTIERCIGHYFYMHDNLKGPDFADSIYKAIDHIDKKRRLTLEKVDPYINTDRLIYLTHINDYSADDFKSYFNNYYLNAEVYNNFLDFRIHHI